MPRPLGEPKHGELAGYDWHKRHGEDACDSCREAKRKHSRDYAKQQREQKAREAPRQEAWFRACGRLAEKYPAEFREILTEELDKVGWEPSEEGQEE